MVRFYGKTIHVFWSKLNSYPSSSRNSAGKINVRRFLVFDFSSFSRIHHFYSERGNCVQSKHTTSETLFWNNSSMNPTTFCMTWKLEPTSRFHRNRVFETTVLWIQRLSAWPENWNRPVGSTGTECLRRQFYESNDFLHDLETGTDHSVPPEPSIWDDSFMNLTTFCMTWKLEPTTRFHRNRVFETTVSWI